VLLAGSVDAAVEASLLIVELLVDDLIEAAVVSGREMPVGRASFEGAFSPEIFD